MTMIKMEMGSPPLLLLAPPPVVSMSTSILLMGPANNEKRKNIRYVYQVISTLSALLFLIKRIQNKFFKKNIAQNISRAVLIIHYESQFSLCTSGENDQGLLKVGGIICFFDRFVN